MGTVRILSALAEHQLCLSEMETTGLSLLVIQYNVMAYDIHNVRLHSLLMPYVL